MGEGGEKVSLPVPLAIDEGWSHDSRSDGSARLPISPLTRVRFTHFGSQLPFLMVTQEVFW